MKDTIKKSFLGGIVFSLTIFSAYFVYAAVSLNAIPNEQLTAEKWNNLVSNITIPGGFVGSFNLAACPTGWLPANGTSGTPDLRGEFIRGLDSGRGVDIGRVLASAQSGTSIAPAYNTLYNGNRNAYIPDEFPISDSDGSYVYSSTSGRSQVNNINYYADWTINKYKVRPRNIALLYCIKQ